MNGSSLDRPPGSTRPKTEKARRFAWLIGSAAATGCSYLVILGWNATSHLAPEEVGSIGTQCVGPYEPAQVVGLAVVLVLLVAVGAWFRQGVPSVVGCIATLSPVFAVDALTVHDPCSDNGLLPLGVGLLAAGCVVGAGVVLRITESVRDRITDTADTRTGSYTQ